MKRTSTVFRILGAMGAVLALVFVLWPLGGCNEEPPASLYVEDYTSAPQPVITAVAPPADSVLSGVTLMTITGSNFAARNDSNFVYFNTTPVPVLQATTTQLVVRAPNIVGDTILIKVGVFKGLLYSAPFAYKIAASTIDFGKFAAEDEPAGLCTDRNGNLYCSQLFRSAGAGVQKYTPSGTKSFYSPAFNSTINKWNGMKVGPGGAIFVTNVRNIIWRIPLQVAPTDSPRAAIWLSGGGLAGLYDLDFDQAGNIWAGGSGGVSIFRVKQAGPGQVKAFPCRANVRAMRVFVDGGQPYVYVGGKRDSLEKIWRYRIISADSLGPEEEYFNVSSIYGANSFGVYAITFNTDGDMYVGTNGPDAILVVHPGGGWEPFYPGVLSGESISFAWGQTNELYVSRVGASAATRTIIKINTLRSGAPYYGSLLP